jgi:TRAP-type C4-dicarboxylate transport system substrate-binding protein
MRTTFKAAVLALGAIVAAPASAQDTISATHVFPASLIYSRSFLEFVKKANAAGKGTFAIQVRGGPEAIGMMEQPGAARNGVVDMVYSPCAFYASVVPECDAISASTIDGPTARKNGGLKLMDQIHQKRAGLVLLGWVDGGIRFNLWSTRAPTLDANGHIDIKGYKVRGNPIYNAFLTSYLGAQVINLPSTELYTALERGTVDITAWTQIGLMDLNWDRYIKYRIGPDFFSTDLMIIMNQKKWNALSPKTREILTRVTAEHEVSSQVALLELWKKEQAELQKRGIRTLQQSDAASKKFVAGARAASLQRMKERMEKSGGMENFDQVVKLFTPG